MELDETYVGRDPAHPFLEVGGVFLRFGVGFVASGSGIASRPDNASLSFSGARLTGFSFGEPPFPPSPTWALPQSPL